MAGGLARRPPTARDLAIAEAIALALPGVLAEAPALLAAWRGREPVERTSTVRTQRGVLDVTLGAPHAGESARPRPTGDVLAALAGLLEGRDEPDPEALRALEDELLQRFEDSPEGRAVPDPRACLFVMDFAVRYFGATVATLDAPDLREILFELIPRKVSVDASEAEGIIRGIRAFYAYLKREHDLTQADACLHVLGPSAARELKAALSDPRNFGMAKSLVMAGRDAGFDVGTPAGIEAWMRATAGQPLPPSVLLPPISPIPARPQKSRSKRKTKRGSKRKPKGKRRR
jgi:hypothetical protein